MTSYLPTVNGWHLALWALAYLVWRWATTPRRLTSAPRKATMVHGPGRPQTITHPQVCPAPRATARRSARTR